MPIELDHTFTTGKDVTYNWEAILDLDRIVPCVEGGTVLERTADDAARAEIKVKMGAMSMTFTGTVTVTERDDDAHRAVFAVRSREKGGGGAANATVTIDLEGDGGRIHTVPQITGKAASMGEGVVASVLDALITDFTQKLSAI
jgi:carbon monoxide dehydrogenase subunit G